MEYSNFSLILSLVISHAHGDTSCVRQKRTNTKANFQRLEFFSYGKQDFHEGLFFACRLPRNMKIIRKTLKRAQHQLFSAFRLIPALTFIPERINIFYVNILAIISRRG